jgi:hypothetical protein
MYIQAIALLLFSLLFLLQTFEEKQAKFFEILKIILAKLSHYDIMCDRANFKYSLA